MAKTWLPPETVKFVALSSETVEKPFNIVNGWFLGVSWPFIIVRSLIMAHSVKSFFSASHLRISLGTFSTVSLEVLYRRRILRKLDYSKQSSEKWPQYSAERYPGRSWVHGHLAKNQMTSVGNRWDHFPTYLIQKKFHSDTHAYSRL